MATLNGTHTPPDALAPPASPTPAESGDKKRKREQHPEAAEATSLQSTTISSSEQAQKDILEILEPHDTTPSFLQYAVEHENSDAARPPKKARISNADHHPTTIASKLASGAYASLNDLSKDAEHVRQNLLSSIRTKAKDREDQKGRLLVDDLKQMQRAQSFEQIIKDIVAQEAHHDSVHRGINGAVKQENGSMANGVDGHAAARHDGRAGTVLTLFGNTPTAKQLFSSLQRSAPGTDEAQELPVEEMGLPIGIAATKIMPVPVDEGKRGPTFEDSFAAPYSIPTLHPPKVHRRSTTREETIRWDFRDPPSMRNKRGGYTVQSLPVAEWLGYGGVEPKDEPSSPREKRKLRDRALSSGESTQPPPSKASMEEALAKEEEALFRKAYSSFAPSCDNSKALVPQEVKSMVWWQKIGQKRYDEAFALDPALADAPNDALLDSLPSSTDVEHDDFSTVVDDFELLEDEPTESEPARDKTSVNDVLDEISELLHTLSSYQRIRNASLQSSSSATRTPISPAPNLSSRIGRADSPGEDEISTYHSLQREIAYLVLQLPPYAVAKLNGDQLAKLGVSKLIALEGRNVKGSMDEDSVARLAKYTAQATAHGLATLTRSGSGSQHYNSTNQRTPAIGQAANTRYGQNQYGTGRAPMTQPTFNRSISNHSNLNSPSATAPRPGYGQTNQYSRPGASTVQSYLHRPIMHNGTGFGGAYANPHTPTAQGRSSYPISSTSKPLAQFQQRSHAAAQNAVSYQATQAANAQQQQHSPFNRSISPLKPATHQPQLQPSPVPRQGQQFQPPPASDRATPTNFSAQQQQRPAASPQPPPQSVQANGHV